MKLIQTYVVFMIALGLHAQKGKISAEVSYSIPIGKIISMTITRAMWI